MPHLQGTAREAVLEFPPTLDDVLRRRHKVLQSGTGSLTRSSWKSERSIPLVARNGRSYTLCRVRAHRIALAVWV